MNHKLICAFYEYLCPFMSYQNLLWLFVSICWLTLYSFFFPFFCNDSFFIVHLQLNGWLSHCSTSVLRHIIFEALCSFLQGENVRNFQNCNFLRRFVYHTAYLKRKKMNIAASRVMRGTAYRPSFSFRVILTTLTLKMWTYSSTLLVSIRVLFGTGRTGLFYYD